MGAMAAAMASFCEWVVEGFPRRGFGVKVAGIRRSEIRP